MKINDLPKEQTEIILFKKEDCVATVCYSPDKTSGLGYLEFKQRVFFNTCGPEFLFSIPLNRNNRQEIADDLNDMGDSIFEAEQNLPDLLNTAFTLEAFGSMLDF